jgi:hypothetical protein
VCRRAAVPEENSPSEDQNGIPQCPTARMRNEFFYHSAASGAIAKRLRRSAAAGNLLSILATAPIIKSAIENAAPSDTVLTMFKVMRQMTRHTGSNE